MKLRDTLSPSRKPQEASKALPAIFVIIILCKIIFILLFLESIQKLSIDAIYYHEYAIGLTDGKANNSWTTLLRCLNEIGLYSHTAISSLTIFIGSIIIPLQVGTLAKQPIDNKNHYWLTAIAISLYPSLFFFSLDIIRDIFMTSLLLLAFHTFKSACQTRQNILLYAASITLGVILFYLRKYLGFAYFAAIILCHCKFLYKKYFLAITVFFMLFFAILFFKLSLLDSILDYRNAFSLYSNSSTFGIKIPTDAHAVEFILKFIISFLYQIVGIYIYSKESLFLFITESIPFLVCLYLLVKNTSSKPSRFFIFLVLFAMLYTFIFVLGNDNLGTAIRLRIPVYISVFLAMLISKSDEGQRKP